MRKLLFAAALLVPGLPLRAAEPCVTLDSAAVAAMFDDWNFALSSLDATQVVQRYWPNAVLLPTVSNTPRTDTAAISDYFEHFLKKRPRGHVDSRTIQSDCNLAVDMGTYTFSLMDDKGTTSNVAARYTFIYQYRDGAWKILHHHSSAMPEAVTSTEPKALVASESAEKADAPAKAPAKSRKQRRVPRKDYLEPLPAAKPAEKPAAAAVAAAKLAPEVKVPAEPKAVSEVKPAAGLKTAAESKVASSAAAPADSKPSAEVRTAMFANLTSSPPPSRFYPPEALRRKERGSVNLRVCADGEGTVSDTMEVVKSSGSKLLDDAAMTWAREVTWVPATYNRRRVEGCAKVDVWFEPPPDLAHARS